MSKKLSPQGQKVYEFFRKNPNASASAIAAKHGKTFADDQWEALEMIVHKIGRIVNGDPDVTDHWVDIAGYATLIAERLEGNAR